MPCVTSRPLTESSCGGPPPAMERAEARRLQPHFIRSFFLEAFPLLGGTVKEREAGRFEIVTDATPGVSPVIPVL